MIHAQQAPELSGAFDDASGFRSRERPQRREVYASAKILAVDDHEPNLMLIRSMMRMAGYRNVTCVSDPRDAVSLFGDAEYDLLLLDLSMPHIDGYEILEIVRESERHSVMPVIVVTAVADNEARIRALRGGATDFLGKPIERTEFLQRIHNCLEIRRLNSELLAQNATLEHVVEERTRELLIAKERAEEASAAKTQFLTIMSHELRSPLNAIIGFAEVIRDQIMGQGVSPNYKGYANDIAQSGSHLLGLINDILDVAKLEAGRVEVTRSRLEVGGLMREVAKMVEAAAREKSLLLTVTAAPDPLVAFCDERALRQILLNLVSNATKFTPDGGSVDLRAERRADGALALSVRDTGIGMDSDQVALALEPFTQLDQSVARRHEGAGLGLTIVKSLAELLGGDLQLKSALGEGVEAVVTLPDLDPDAGGT